MSDIQSKDSGFGIGELGKVPEGENWMAKQRAINVDRFVKCDCGHYVEKGLVMSASMGTSCPDCYDRMSD